MCAQAAGAKPLPHRELIMVLVTPAATALVRLLQHTAVRPHHVVLTHTVVGLAAAALLATGSYSAWLLAALLLQVKTVLDNTDGALARSTGRVTQMGRYLDTLMDLVVNAALFWALAQHGPAWLAALAFAALTILLSAEFNAMNRHLEELGRIAVPAPEGAPAAVMALLRGGYDLLLAPQDRLLRRLDEALFERAAGERWGLARPAERRRWADPFSTAALVNLGLSTQMLLLGLCAMASLPYAYVVLVFVQVGYVAVVQAVRVRRYRAGGAS